MNRPSTSYGDSNINKYNARYPARENRNRVSPRQGHRGDLNESGSQERMVNRKGSRESQENVDARSESFEEDMEIGYEESGPSEVTFERLEQKFQDEIMRAIKQQGDLEDEEIVRHKERMLEINTQYQERMSSLRVQHATRLGELLRKESQARLNHYQQAAISTHKTERGPTEPRDYDWSTSRRYGTMPDDCNRSMPVEPPKPYGTLPNDRHRSMPAEAPIPFGTMPNDSRRLMAIEPPMPYGTMPNDSHRLIDTGPPWSDGSMPYDSHRSMPYETMLNDSHRLIATEPPRSDGSMPYDSHRSMPEEPPRPYGIIATEPPKLYGTVPSESYRKHSQYREAERSRVSEERVPIPRGRVYNNLGGHG